MGLALRVGWGLGGGDLGLSVWALIVLAGIFCFTSAVSMVTGSTSLITVPALFQAGVEPQAAIATSKLVNIFSSPIATLIFIYLGLVNFGLGLLLGVAMFLGPKPDSLGYSPT